MTHTEFDIIDRYFKRPPSHKTTALSIGDDAALSTLPPEHQLVTSIDSLINGIHFPENTAPFDVGHKSLAVSLSDMAAMGATPISCLLALTLPDADEQWTESFAKGFFALAEQHHIDLIGGDTTHGPLSISTVVQGIVPNEKALTRANTKPGDHIFVSGTLGDAGFALHQLQNNEPCNAFFLKKLNQPTPRVALGLALQNIASSAIDISDGLIADLKHILKASHVGASIHTEKLPLSTQLIEQTDKQHALTLALGAGDDYELCFTVPENKLDAVNALKQDVMCIGIITDNKSLEILGENNKTIRITSEGYCHFGTVS